MTRSSNPREVDFAPPGFLRNATSRAAGVLCWVRSLLRREEGGIAVEFALLLPVLAVGLVFLGWMGERTVRLLNMEQILRAGAEAAVADPGFPETIARMRRAALAKGYVIWPGNAPVPPDHLWLDAARNCSCPESPNIESSCRSCVSGRPPIVRYTLSAHYQSSAGSRLYESINLIATKFRMNVGSGSHGNVSQLQKVVLVR